MKSRNLFRYLIPAIFTFYTATSGATLIVINSGSWILGSGWGSGCTSSACNGEGDSGTGQSKVTGNHTLLNMDWAIDSGLSQTVDLTAGISQSIVFGSGIFKDEDGKLDSAETDNLGITAMLNLTASNTIGQSVGAVSYATGSLNDDTRDLWISFASFNVDLGALGILAIDFSDPEWNCNPGTQDCTWNTPQSRTITALFTLTDPQVSPTAVPESDVTSIPEPSSLLLFGLGLAGLSVRQRLRTR